MAFLPMESGGAGGEIEFGVYGWDYSYHRMGIWIPISYFTNNPNIKIFTKSQHSNDSGTSIGIVATTSKTYPYGGKNVSTVVGSRTSDGWWERQITLSSSDITTYTYILIYGDTDDNTVPSEPCVKFVFD